MELICIILLLFMAASIISTIVLLYELIRYRSGIFKPQYSEEEIKNKIVFYENAVKYGKDYSSLDSLDFWTDQLKIMNRYNKLHRRKDDV